MRKRGWGQRARPAHSGREGANSVATTSHQFAILGTADVGSKSRQVAGYAAGRPTGGNAKGCATAIIASARGAGSDGDAGAGAAPCVGVDDLLSPVELSPAVLRALAISSSALGVGLWLRCARRGGVPVEAGGAMVATSSVGVAAGRGPTISVSKGWATGGGPGTEQGMHTEGWTSGVGRTTAATGARATSVAGRRGRCTAGADGAAAAVGRRADIGLRGWSQRQVPFCFPAQAPCFRSTQQTAGRRPMNGQRRPSRHEPLCSMQG